MTFGYKTWKDTNNEIITFYGKHYLSKEYTNMLYGLINECESNKYGNYGFIYITKRECKMLLKLLRKLIFDELTNNFSLKNKINKRINELKNYNGSECISGSDLSVEEFNLMIIDELKDILKGGE